LALENSIKRMRAVGEPKTTGQAQTHSTEAEAAIARAEAALKALEGEFGDWIKDETANLQSAHTSILTQGATDETRRGLYLAAHDLKGLATTYGYPAVSQVAGTLCKLLEAVADNGDLPAALVAAHVDAIVTMVRIDLKNDADPAATELLTELSAQVAAITSA
jgi:HPt (histidine-containing phosphotransfer) domain-containing protein